MAARRGEKMKQKIKLSSKSLTTANFSSETMSTNNNNKNTHFLKTI